MKIKVYLAYMILIKDHSPSSMEAMTKIQAGAEAGTMKKSCLLACLHGLFGLPFYTACPGMVPPLIGELSHIYYKSRKYSADFACRLM